MSDLKLIKCSNPYTEVALETLGYALQAMSRDLPKLAMTLQEELNTCNTCEETMQLLSNELNAQIVAYSTGIAIGVENARMKTKQIRKTIIKDVSVDTD